jgi:hypothetical protein
LNKLQLKKWQLKTEWLWLQIMVLEDNPGVSDIYSVQANYIFVCKKKLTVTKFWHTHTHAPHFKIIEMTLNEKT